MAISFKGAHFPKEIILTGVRWYVAYPLSYRHVEELMEERGVLVDHATIQRWVVKYSPLLEAAFHRRKRPVWISWRMDETYIKIKGQWRYLYRTVDKQGQTVDFLLTEQRDEHAAKRFLTQAIRRHRVPEKITIDGSAANEAAIKSYNEAHGTAIVIRQVKYLNNIVEQDHRAVKRMTRPMLGFKSFAAAQATLVGIELMHMIKKRQMVSEAGDEASLRPNSSTLSPPNPRTTSGFSPHIGYMSEIATKPGNVVLGFHNASPRCSLHSIYTLPWDHAPNLHAGAMVLHGARIVSSWHATNNAKMPRRNGALPEVAYVPAPTAAPDQSGVCRAVSRPAPLGTTELGRARRACGVGADDALPLAGRAAGVHTPRPGWRAGPVKRGVRTMGAAETRGRAPGETVAVESR